MELLLPAAQGGIRLIRSLAVHTLSFLAFFGSRRGGSLSLRPSDGASPPPTATASTLGIPGSTKHRSRKLREGEGRTGKQWDPSGRFHVGFIREGEAEGNPRLAARKPNPREKNGEAPDLLPLPSQKTAFPRQKSKVVLL
ncbi:hypothetical protein BHM03_00022252 [Ensete ventricosum]|nr:hypothetical protein BHM03_00022252 [Ensete ventricosum]